MWWSLTYSGSTITEIDLDRLKMRSYLREACTISGHTSPSPFPHPFRLVPSFWVCKWLLSLVNSLICRCYMDWMRYICRSFLCCFIYCDCKKTRLKIGFFWRGSRGTCLLISLNVIFELFHLLVLCQTNFHE